nr:hypothetical protein [Desulfobacterales bacterium]
MVCATVKKGQECTFMSKKGCTFNGGSCYQIVDQCKGCNHVTEFSSGWYCTAYPDPSAKWRNGNCNFATHLKQETKNRNNKTNPLKASKRNFR